MSRDLDAPTDDRPSSAWGDVGITVGLLVVWLTLTRWILPAMGFPSCADGACGAPAMQDFRPTASGVGPIAPGTIEGDISR